MSGTPAYDVVIPARDAGATLGLVLDALAAERPAPARVLVVDDGSRDRTAEIAGARGAELLTGGGPGSAGGARNRGWEAASAPWVVFLDADVVPDPGWAAGLVRALGHWPGAIVGCAHTFPPGGSRWRWSAYLQLETPFLASGEPRPVAFLPSYCLAVPRALPLRFDPSYGGEDVLFCADARAAGVPVIFDPRFSAAHHHHRDGFADVRRLHRRVAYSAARNASLKRFGPARRVVSRAPLHHVLLVRLPLVYARVRRDPALRRRFLVTLPWLAAAEWSLAASTARYAVRPRPPQRSAASSQ